MFIEILILSIILGYLLKGSLKNLKPDCFKGLYLVFLAFAIEATIIFLIKHKFIVRGGITYILDFIMYLLLAFFIFKNKNNKYIVIIGLGFLLNSLPIFLNAGAMPVSREAVVQAGLAPTIDSIKVSNEGLYTIINESTRFWFLGDIIPKPFLRAAVVSIGDIISTIGLMFLVITGMRNQSLD